MAKKAKKKQTTTPKKSDIVLTIPSEHEMIAACPDLWGDATLLCGLIARMPKCRPAVMRAIRDILRTLSTLVVMLDPELVSVANMLDVDAGKHYEPSLVNTGSKSKKPVKRKKAVRRG